MKTGQKYILIDIKNELPKKYTKHVLFFNKTDKKFYDCRFWFDGDGIRTHISPNLYALGYLQDYTGFTHWLKPINEMAAEKKVIEESKNGSKFNRTIAKDIAETSFGYVLDCILGYSDADYHMGTKASEFEQNFEEDLEEKNIVITDKRIKLIAEYYEKMRLDFISKTRKKFYDKHLR